MHNYKLVGTKQDAESKVTTTKHVVGDESKARFLAGLMVDENGYESVTIFDDLGTFIATVLPR